MTQLSCKRGDTTSFLIRSRVVDLFAVDGLIYTVKTRFGDADTSAVLQKELAYGVEVLSSDTARVSLVHADTKPLDPAITYKWDLQAQQGGTVTTVDQGTLRVDADVTREVAVSISIIQVEPANPASLGAEVTARQSADLSLKTEISTSVSVEASARTSADASLSTALAAETSARVSTDTVHSNALALRVVKDASGNTEALNSLLFDTTPTVVAHTPGLIQWNESQGVPEFHSKYAGVRGQINKELWVEVRNNTGASIADGKCVYLSGSVGQMPTIALADADFPELAHKVIGLTTMAIANNANGMVTVFGQVNGLNTSAFAEGDMLYLSQTPGELTKVRPSLPAAAVVIGQVENAHNTQGVISVRPLYLQSAAEVGLASIVGISATDVQGAVSELLSDITAETSARISGDASVSTALSTAISQRISADASLSTALSVETSRAVSVENTKADKNNGTHTGTTSIADPRLGSGGAKAWCGSWATVPGAFAAYAHANFLASQTGYAIRQGSSGNTYVNSESGWPLIFCIGDSPAMTIASDKAVTVNNAITVSGLASLNGGASVNGTTYSKENLTVGDGTANKRIIINSGPSAGSHLEFKKAGLYRAAFSTTIEPEEGGNSGSNVVLQLFNDAGGILREWLKVTRATGAATINGDTTVNGLATLNGGSLAGSGTAKAWAGSWAGSNATNAAWSHGAFATDAVSYALRQSDVGATTLNAASGQAIGFRIANAFVANLTTSVFDVQVPLTANTITNYAADVTVSALLALTPAQSAAKRKATVTGAYRMDGTLGRVEAWWDGDATAGNWVMRSGVAVTADADVFMDSCAAKGIHMPVPQSGGKLRVIQLPVVGDGQPIDTKFFTSGGVVGVSSASNMAEPFADLAATSVGSYSGTPANNTYHNWYHAARIQYVCSAYISALSDETNQFFAEAGLGFNAQHIGNQSAQLGLFVYDPHNGLGLGINNNNWWAVTVAASFAAATVTDTLVAVATTEATAQRLEVATRSSGARVVFSINNVVVATHTTNLPQNVLSVREGIKKTLGVNTRNLRIKGRSLTILSA